MGPEAAIRLALPPERRSGIYLGLDNKVYRNAEGLSHSDSKRLRKSPWHFYAMTLGERPPESAPSAAMRNGTMVHCALLEPEAFDSRYWISPEGLSKNSNEYKRLAEIALAAGQEAITVVEYQRAQAQAAALRADPVVADLLRQDGPSEVSMWWTCPRTGVLCKGRPDRVAAFGWGKKVILLDIKTTADADEFAFAKSCANFGYHTQADWYCEGYALAAGVEVEGMVFGVVEADYPHAARSFMLSDNALERARAENDNARRLYKSCSESGNWPGYPAGTDGVTVIDLPKWY